MALNLLSGLDAKVANRRIEEVESSDVMPLVKVGSFLLNAWGLYDMHGNVREWCLDRMNGGGLAHRRRGFWYTTAWSMTYILTRLCMAGAAVLFAAWLVVKLRVESGKRRV